MVKILQARPNLADQVYEAIVDEICSGALAEGAHLVQEQLAARLGVSRQPVQQAMARLKNDGLVAELGRRGLHVTPLNPELMRRHYQIRAALDGLAARLAAERARAKGAADLRRRGAEVLAAGHAAVAERDCPAQVHQDEALHRLIYEFSGNPLIARTAEPHWRFLRRAMGAVLRQADLPGEIWRQHEEIVAAIAAGDAEGAERLSVRHALQASQALHGALTAQAATA